MVMYINWANGLKWIWKISVHNTGTKMLICPLAVFSCSKPQDASDRQLNGVISQRCNMCWNTMTSVPRQAVPCKPFNITKLLHFLHILVYFPYFIWTQAESIHVHVCVPTFETKDHFFIKFVMNVSSLAVTTHSYVPLSHQQYWHGSCTFFWGDSNISTT
jgi:hypothetical protein